MRRTLVVAAVFGFTVVGCRAGDDLGAGEVTETLSPLRAPFQSMTGDELFAKLLEHNRLRDIRLQRYSAVRTYDVASDKGKVYAEEVVRVEYRAPDHKSFVTDSEKGSALVRDLVLKRLIESESATSRGRAHHDSSIRPANYEFTLLGEQDVGPYHCLVVRALPRRQDKYLFEGKVWIDTEDYAIVRIAGHPAKSLSFWITRADFVRQYQRIGDFWLPAKDETLVHVRLYGKKILTIHHGEYVVNEDAGGTGSGFASEDKPSGTR
jgi:hypothetical protein